jgi:biopolymer transport protein ExbD
MDAGGGNGNGGSGGGGGLGGYRSMRARSAPKAMGEINVTPLVDVVLVLLLVFMITAPMMSRGIDVTLPSADIRQTDEQERITVSVNAQGQVYLNDRIIVLPLLIDQLQGMMEGRASKVVYLRADERLLYGKVIEVVDAIKKAGVEQVGFVYVLPEEKAARR